MSYVCAINLILFLDRIPILLIFLLKTILDLQCSPKNLPSGNVLIPNGKGPAVGFQASGVWAITIAPIVLRHGVPWIIYRWGICYGFER